MVEAYCVASGQIDLKDSVHQLLDKRAKENPTKEAYIFRPDEEDRVSFTFDYVRQATESLAVWMLRHGLRTSDKIGILSQNRPEFLLIELAAARIGVILVRLYATMDSKMELTRVLSAGKCRMIFTQNQSLKSVLALAPEAKSKSIGEKLKISDLPDLENIVSFEKSEFDGILTLPKYESVNATADELTELDNIQNSMSLDDDCTVYATSGSTGMPKLIMHSYEHAITHLTEMLKRCGLRNDDVWFMDRPMAHGVGSVYIALYFGATQVFANPWLTLKPGHDYLASIFKQEGVTCGLTFPYALYDIIQNTEGDLSFADNIRFLAFGGQIVNREILRRVRAKLDIAIVNAYGTTETGCICSCFPKDGADTVAQYVGSPVKSELKVVNENGETVKIGEEGQLAVHSPGHSWRYLDDEIMKRTHSDGFWFTGDNARMEKNGYVQILGRRDDVISVGTVKVYPSPIEQKINELENVDMALVFGVPDERLKEVIGAAVMPKKGTTLTADDVINHFRSSLSESDLMTGVAMVPKFVWIEEEFPKIASGKVDKKGLRKRCLAELQ